MPYIGDANLHHPVYFNEKIIDQTGFRCRAFFTSNIFFILHILLKLGVKIGW